MDLIRMRLACYKTRTEQLELVFYCEEYSTDLLKRILKNFGYVGEEMEVDSPGRFKSANVAKPMRRRIPPAMSAPGMPIYAERAVPISGPTNVAKLFVV